MAEEGEEMSRFIARLVIASILMAMATAAIEYYQAPALVSYWIGLVSGASILALFEVLEARERKG